MAYQTGTLKTLIARTEGKLGKYQNTYASTLLAEQRRLLQAVDGIASMRENPNSLETPAAHALKMSKTAQKLAEESAKIKDRAYKNYQDYKVQLGLAIHEKANIKQDGYAQEIRALYRSLNDKEKMDMVLNAVNNVDSSVFSALMLAPQALTGISERMNKDMTKSFYQKAAPELSQELQDLDEAMDSIVTSIHTTEGVAKQISNPVTMKRIEEEVQKAQEAANKFTSAVA